ncbi:hypothetical protein HN832_00740 [archaeon]|jgi:hypothetical protein|nr:hypothetical protein [archaeon]MBT4373851.1 hypothetical protein [archaeon]MBT4532373.1 hypothetical protein [archaeon]MBT7001754.1 hypothetical protein [archaeon]MBT7281921.1 hypothetical protein [archaeon]
MKKRGQIATGITWIPALVIVFLIMLVFVVGSVSLAKNKNNQVDNPEDVPLFKVTTEFDKIMETEMVYSEQKMTFKNILKEMLEPYLISPLFDTKFNGDINNLKTILNEIIRDPNFDPELTNEFKVFLEKEYENMQFIKDHLPKPKCINYRIDLPSETFFNIDGKIVQGTNGVNPAGIWSKKQTETIYHAGKAISIGFQYTRICDE